MPGRDRRSTSPHRGARRDYRSRERRSRSRSDTRNKHPSKNHHSSHEKDRRSRFSDEDRYNRGRNYDRYRHNYGSAGSSKAVSSCQESRFPSTLRNERNRKSHLAMVEKHGGVKMIQNFGSSSLMERKQHEADLLVKDIEIQEQRNEILEMKLQSMKNEGSSFEMELQDQGVLEKLGSSENVVELPPVSAAETIISFIESVAGDSESEEINCLESVDSMSVAASSVATSATISADHSVDDGSLFSNSPSAITESTPLPVSQTAAINAGSAEGTSAKISADFVPVPISKINMEKNAVPISYGTGIPPDLVKTGRICKQSAKITADSTESTAPSTSADLFDTESSAESDSEAKDTPQCKKIRKTKKIISDVEDAVEVVEIPKKQKKHKKKDDQKISANEESNVFEKLQPKRRFVKNSAASKEHEVIDIDPVEPNEAAPRDDTAFGKALLAIPLDAPKNMKTQVSKLAESMKKNLKGTVLVLGPLPDLMIRKNCPAFEAVQVVQNLENSDGIEIVFLHCTEKGTCVKKCHSLTLGGMSKLYQRTSWHQISTQIEIVSGRKILDKSYPPTFPIIFE